MSFTEALPGGPDPGARRLLSKQSFVEVLKALFKFLIIGWVAYSTVRDELPEILNLSDQEVGGIFRFIGFVSARIFFKTVLVMVALAALDYLFQRWSYEKSLRMTKREIQEEFKQTEGDPLVKSRIRSIQREMARRRMMSEVPKADVVITTPPIWPWPWGMRKKRWRLPRFWPKGRESLPRRSRRSPGPIKFPWWRTSRSLRRCFKTVDLGQVIPSALYQVVADILAHVYRMKNRTL